MAKKLKTTVTRKEFSDLYILSALSGVIAKEGRTDLVQYRNQLISEIANYYIGNVRVALENEACHHMERRYPKSDPLKKIELEKRLGLTEEKYRELFNTNSGSTTDWEKMNVYIRNLSNQGLIEIFRYCDWSPAFGGEAWAGIAELHAQLVGWKNVIAEEYFNNTHHLIADHISGEFYNKINGMMTVIDRLHQAEHNTGSIFTKFGDMTTWLHLALNEKAIRNSLQLLKVYASPNIVKAIGSLNAEIVPESEIELQLGETIMSRARTKYLKKCEYNKNSNIDQKKLCFEKGQITLEEFEKKKEKYIKQYEDACNEPMSSMSVAETMRDLYYSKAYREARGVLRCIIAQENNKDLISDCSGTVIDLCMKDKDSVEVACQNDKLKKYVTDHFINSIDYYQYYHPSYKNAYDFLFERFDELVNSGRLFPKQAANLYKRFVEGQYDLSKITKPVGVKDPAPKVKPSYESMAAKHPNIASMNVKDFATIYAGEKIKATHAYAGEIAAYNSSGSWAFEYHLGKVIGYASDKIIYTPSSMMKSKGYPGCKLGSIHGATYTVDASLLPEVAYTSHLGNVELVNPPQPTINAPYGLKKDGTPKKKPGKKSKAEIEAAQKANDTLNNWKEWEQYCDKVGGTIGINKSKIIEQTAKEKGLPVVKLPRLSEIIKKATGTNPCAEQPLEGYFFDAQKYFNNAILTAFNLPKEFMVLKYPEDDIITKKPQ